MRILLTVHQFFPEFKAGTEVLTLSVAKQLIALGHEVYVFTGFPGEENTPEDQRLDNYTYDGVSVSRFKHAYTPMFGQKSMIEVGYKNLLAQHFFIDLVTDFKPDYVHHFHLNRLGVGLIEYLHQQRIPQFFTPTDFWMICPTAQLMWEGGRYCAGPDKHAGNCIKHFARDRLGNTAGKMIELVPASVFATVARLTKKSSFIAFPMSQEMSALHDRLGNTVAALNKLDGIVTPNNFMRELFINHGVKQEKIHNCHFGVDIKVPDITLEKREVSNKPCYGFIGTLAPHKGCHVVIDALNKLPKGMASLKIYGGHSDFPEYYENLVKLAGDNPDIEFCGTFDNNDIGVVIAKFDALIVPSVWYENTPLVIYSAHACQCPVIASDLPGIAEVVKEGVNGILYEAGNSNELSAIFSSLSNNPEKLNDLRHGCQPPLSVKTYTQKLLDIWNGH
ncbi:glycosyltransferase (plasmid) [Citrobacter freundii]|nr:glycosyltransferase [Citrobacter freundii]QLO06794.1 glycosyltransferase [Citrobacter freundii]